MNNLEQALYGVRKDFFPRWDRKRGWGLHLVPRGVLGRADGLCDRGKRTITISEVSPDPDERDELLIHEICHAVTNRDDHGTLWQARMRATVRRARAVGRERLAGKLEEDMAGYDELNRLFGMVGT